MASARNPALLLLLMEASAGLGEVEAGEAHGFQALSAGGRPFALIVPDGSIGVRLPDWDLFTAAFELPGSRPLYENDQRVGHWVVLPRDVHDDVTALREWLRHAHALTAGRV